MNKKIINQLEINYYFTEKFKTSSFALVFFSEYNQKNIVLNHILSHLLSTTSKKYPTKKEFANRVYELYHTNFAMFSRNYDETLMTIVLVTIADPKMIQEDSYFQEVKEFFWETLLKPNLIDDLFQEKDFVEEKKLMIASIQNGYNNKEAYAYNRLIEEMAPNEIINIKPQGTIDAVEAITLADLTSYYHHLLNKCDCKGYAIGNISTQIIDHFFECVPFITTNTIKKLFSSPHITSKEVRFIEEVQNVNQGKLVLGYRTNIHYFDRLYFALVLFDLMLTGMTTSSLFKIVREQHGLAYSIHSSVQYDAKILTIHAGIEEKNKKKTIHLIGDILKNYQQNVEESLLEMAKETLISYYMETKDDCQSLLIFQIRTDLIKKLSIDEIITKIKQVKTDQIIEVANQVFLDTVYFLHGENNE